MADSDADDRLIVVGRIGAPHGIHGWVRVTSSTRPPEAILEFSCWWLGPQGAEREYRVEQTRIQGERIVARLAGVGDRETATGLRHATIAVPRSDLPPADDGEWYWADLVGLRVVTTQGDDLGAVDHLLETGANDVLVAKGDRERLIPWIPEQVIIRVDRQQQQLVVDWDPDF